MIVICIVKRRGKRGTCDGESWEAPTSLFLAADYLYVVRLLDRVVIF